MGQRPRPTGSARPLVVPGVGVLGLVFGRNALDRSFMSALTAWSYLLSADASGLPDSAWFDAMSAWFDAM